MTTSPLTIEAILGPDGLLARSLENFEFRPSQLEMARLIWQALQQGIPAMMEAGTGTGKTFGYLVPLILSGKKTVISTGTKNLQEQIYFKDLPLLEHAIGLRADAVLMKGRKNYLCLYRYHQHFVQPSLLNPELQEAGKRLERWMKRTKFADRAELSWITDDDMLWEALTCGSEQCLGANCLFLEDCFLNRLRSRAAAAKLIIVNHHLFFADMKVKRGGFGEVIPRFQVALFDEAHGMEEVATSHFGESLSTRQLVEFANELEKEVKAHRVAEEGNLKAVLAGMKAASEQLRNWFNGPLEKDRFDPETLSRISAGPGREIRKALRQIQQSSSMMKKESSVFHALLARAGEMDRSVERILSFKGSDWLNWWERRKRSLVVHLSPLDISEGMRKNLYDHVKTVIFTSATLSTNGDFEYVRSRLGLRERPVLEGTFPSHFDFERQTLMYVPKDLPAPGDLGFGSKLAHRIKEILDRSAGRALVLFTSYQNMDFVYELLKEQVVYTIYKQGEAPKTMLLESFRRETHSVLFATKSFWQGVDIPGETLSCLVIDKLPFDSPGEPLTAARIDAIRARGGNPFLEYQVPSAVISLKQGLGRLIRKSSDRGILSVLDHRIVTARYGKFFMNSLPNIPMCHELAPISGFFEKEKGDDHAS